MNALNTKRILSRKRGNRGHRKTVKTGHRLNVSLNPCPAAGIGTGDNQNLPLHGGSPF
jgi:hypothetical protein